METENIKAVSFMNEKEAADYLRLSRRTLQKMRVTGLGPAYYQPCRRVLYKIDELNAWANSCRRTSTSEAA